MRILSKAAVVCASAALLAGCAWSSQPMVTTTTPTATATPVVPIAVKEFPSCGSSPALVAACETARDFGTYDYRTFKIPGWAFLDDLTPKYRADYIKQAAGFPDFIKLNKAIASAKVTAAFARSVSTTTAAARVSIAMHTTGTGSTENPTLSLAFILVKQADGQWRVDFMTKA